MVDGYLVWGSRVVIPIVFRAQLLDELHSNHVGVCRMKALARSYVWWPQLNSAIESLAMKYQQCSLSASAPPTAPAHPWLVPHGPWECIHVDHAQWKNWLLLVAVDAFSKWPEVFVVASTFAKQTADKLRRVFATHGLPVTLVSDNGTPFASTEFRHFMTSNGITHRRVPPYHPSSNGLAEKILRSVKQALNKASKLDTIETKIAKFLSSYRNTPHSVTGRTPAEILLGHAPRTRLSLVHPCLSQRMAVATEEHVGSHSPRTFEPGQAVYLQDLRPSATSKWVPADIAQKLGPLAYKVNIDGYTGQAHIDHLKPRLGTQPQQEVLVPDSGVADADDPIPLVVVEEEDSDEAMNTTPGTISVRPQRDRRPPRRLIEQLP